MKGRPVDQLVFELMMPRPKPSDPNNFNGILSRHLVFEVRQEVHSFYGHLDTQEAKYPGLDYTNHIHRTRLSRWPWHRRLFRAFDALGLTAAEIASLTKWEGTKWAKERYEKEQGITIHDTSADDLPDWRLPGSRYASSRKRDHMMNRGTMREGRDVLAMDLEDEMEEDEAKADGDNDTLVGPLTSQPVPRSTTAANTPQGSQDAHMNDGTDSSDENSDGDLDRSIGLQLHALLRRRIPTPNNGDASQLVDGAWEQLFVSAIDDGDVNTVIEQLNRLSSMPQTRSTFCHQLIRELSSDNSTQYPTTAGVGSSTATRQYADIRALRAMLVSVLEAANSQVAVARQEASTRHGVAARQQAVMAASSSGAAAASTPSTTSAAGNNTPGRRQTQTLNWHRSYSDLRLPRGETSH